MFNIMTKHRAKPKKRAEGKERFTVYVHPLFVLFGIWFFWRGELFLFLVYTLVAVIHEFGHAQYAARIGCRLTRLRLLPCGAVVSGDIEGIPLADEIRLALAGPFVNAACAALFAALWWVFPETYPYTDTAAFASLFLAIINLFPAYPLDGGRIVACIAVRKKGEGFAHRLMLVLGILFFILFCTLFVLSFFSVPNFSALFFALFVLVGTLGARDERYSRISFDLSRQLSRGMCVRQVAVSGECTLRRALSFLERGKMLELLVFDDSGELFCVLSQREFLELAQKNPITDTFSQILADE